MTEATDKSYILQESSYLQEGNCSKLKSYAENLGIEIPENIDSKVFQTIVYNKLLDLRTEKEIDDLRNNLFKFSEKVRHIQHYFFHSKQITITRLLGKLLTRIWWIYHTSSPLMKSWKSYEQEVDLEDSELLPEDSDIDYESESESDEDTDAYVSEEEEEEEESD